MSEQCSLYVKIEISKEQLKRFFKERPTPAIIDNNWQQWWDSRQMYSKELLTNLPNYPKKNNRAAFEQLLQQRESVSVEQYNENDNSWTFLTLFFSENYFEIIPMLALLKELAYYQQAHETGVAFVYDFYWDRAAVMAYLEFTNQKALLKTYTVPTEIPTAILAEANDALEAVVSRLN